MQKFKPENVGETRITITEGQFKDYVIIVHTAVSKVIFENKYDTMHKGIPEFRVTHHDSFTVIPPIVKSVKGSP